MVFRNKKRNGFTLLEILVVIAILGILATLVVPRLGEKPKQAKRLKAVLQIRVFRDALEEFYIDHGAYPTTDEGLAYLLRKGKYLDSEKIPLDPWNHPYLYLSPGLDGRSYDVVSLGEDGERGGKNWAQDIESWHLEEA